MIRKWDINDKRARKKCADEIIQRIDDQGDSVFGQIAAEEIIQIVANHLGPEIYNLAIDDARNLVQNKLADLDVELDVLTAAS